MSTTLKHEQLPYFFVASQFNGRVSDWSFEDLRVSGLKSWHRQTGLLFNQIPVDLYKIELTQIIQVWCSSKYCNLAIGGIIVGGDKKPNKLLINWKNIQSIQSKALC